MTTFVIKKYKNRRLYNVTTGAYTSTQELALAAQLGTEFTVFDGDGKDITQYVLIQIVAEIAPKAPLLSSMVLKQLICVTGSHGRSLVPAFVERWTELMNSISHESSSPNAES